MGDGIVVGVVVAASVGPAKPVSVPVGSRLVVLEEPNSVVSVEGVKIGRARRAMRAKSGVASALLKQKRARRVSQKVALIGAIAPELNALGQLR